MESSYWHPRCTRPEGLVRPVRLDPLGVVGPTRGQARSSKWRKTSTGWYVPGDVDAGPIEQRILEQSVRIPEGGALTGWAALRWRGAHYFTGRDPVTRADLAVPIVLGGWRDLGRDSRIVVSRERFWWHELEIVAEVPCAIPERALFEELRRTRRPRPAVVDIDMAAAAGLIELPSMECFVATRNGWTGVPFARAVLLLASPESRSPQESRMRLVWMIDAGFPPPLCNKPVFDLHGRLLGYPDLLDPVAGVVGEYDGSDHTRLDRRKSDAAREQPFRDHGLEYFDLVRGDLADTDHVVRRMHSARGRAKFLPPDQCKWTLEPPPWRNRG
jgi:hypothetical protein